MFFSSTTVLKMTPLHILLMLMVVPCVNASATVQNKCDVSAELVSSLQKQHVGNKAQLIRLRHKIVELGMQPFTGAKHCFREFTLKLPLGSTILPVANNDAVFQFDGLSTASGVAGVSLYDVDYGAAAVAVIPDSEDAVQWERFFVATVRSPEDILYRESDGVIYYDHKNKELVALYHQFNKIVGQHIVGRASVAAVPCPMESQRLSTCSLSSTRNYEPVECSCAETGKSNLAALRASARVGSGLSAESDMPRSSANIIATAGTASANAHSRCPRQQRTSGIAEIVRRYSMLRTLNPKYRRGVDTYTKAYSINNYGVKDAYIVWNENKEGGVLLADGTVVVPPKYCSLYVDSFGYVVTDDHGVGILDFSGNTILPCKYTLFTLCDDGLLKVGLQLPDSDTMQYGIFDLQKRTWVEPISM